jgi:diadenosine tetraphosphate (Ap4A) HIT family hydrolase
MGFFEKLKSFISKDMRMSQIYQPVMLIELLKSGGKASVPKIAQAILNRDPSQIEYYSQIVKNMVGRVLTNNRGITSKENDVYQLIGSSELTASQTEELIRLCEIRIAKYENDRDGAHWDHRRRSRRAISGTVRYEVLKRASFRCESCGISASDKNLEVDHIEPKSLGGIDDLSNYQALCYTCNSQKNNRDNTDWRIIRKMYDLRATNCIFCSFQNDRKKIEAENSLAFVIKDGMAVTNGHTLVIPKRHTSQYFDLRQPEINSIHSLLTEQKEALSRKDPSIVGFNIGVNCGEAAGQTVMHCHIHLIPRRQGDVANPRGGVRNIFPGKGDY